MEKTAYDSFKFCIITIDYKLNCKEKLQKKLIFYYSNKNITILEKFISLQKM